MRYMLLIYTDESLGELRKVNVSAGGKYFVDQSKIAAMLDKLILAAISGGLLRRDGPIVSHRSGILLALPIH